MKAIMSMAHEVRAAAANTYGGKPGDYVMSIALQMAHEAVKNAKEKKMNMNGGMYTISGFEGYKGFPWRVLKRFDSPEAIIEHILKSDDEEINWLAVGSVVVASKWIAEDKCIPRQYVTANGGKLLDALRNSSRPGAAEAAAKVEAATAWKDER